MKNIPKWIIVHHTGGTDQDPRQDTSTFTVSQCNTLHQQKFNMVSSLGWYVGYHYYIEKNGFVTQCRADGDEGAHTVGRNRDSIGICLAGNFDATLPTESQKIALRQLLIKKTTEYAIPTGNIVPHRLFATKTCYGNKLSDTWAKDLLNVVYPVSQPVTPPIKKVDGVTPLLSKLVSSIGNKNYKEAKETASYLLSELNKLI